MPDMPAWITKGASVRPAFGLSFRYTQKPRIQNGQRLLILMASATNHQTLNMCDRIMFKIQTNGPWDTMSKIEHKTHVLKLAVHSPRFKHQIRQCMSIYTLRKTHLTS